MASKIRLTHNYLAELLSDSWPKYLRIIVFSVASIVSSIKHIYKGNFESFHEKMVRRVSRRGLSPLLAIIIGLVVTVVAGILLAQLYFSYAATISARPAANVEYIDLVTNGTNSYLVINIKNMGQVAIMKVSVDDRTTTCSIPDESVPPGGTVGCAVSLDDAVQAGEIWTGYVTVTFADGSTQMYAISARARSA